MISFDTLLAIIFILALSIYLYHHRKRIEVQKILFPAIYVVMMRMKLGIKFMDRLAKKFPKTLRGLGYVGIVVGFLGMILIAVQLIVLTIQIFTGEASAAGVGLVLPVCLPGVICVPFSHWIISIFAIAIIHEASHGIIARAHKIKVKNSGWAFLCVLLPIIPAAFVEPDEKVMTKRPAREQLSVFAAGPWSNILTGLLFLLIVLVAFAPFNSDYNRVDGVSIASIVEDSPLAQTGLEKGDIITSLDGTIITSGLQFTELVNNAQVGESIELLTAEKSHSITPREKEGKAFLGVFVREHSVIKEGVSPIAAGIFNWFYGLFRWLFILSVGIGLFNLVPMGPIDGGRMLKLVTDRYLGKYSGKVFGFISLLFVALIVINIVAGFIL